ncbi:hypothetical protein EDB80DRAFT_874775 [Ilyonectria destructans]|nr:hypothetical protein EDB80DRAFT_874775 [Ilyonectria destructans]
MVAPQMDCGMRPPSSYLGQLFNGQINRQQVVAIQAQRHQQQQTGQSGPLIQWRGDPNGNPMPQATEDHIQGPPQRRPMPPPSAPSKANDNAKSRIATSSPQTTKVASPTPSQSNKASLKKKEPKTVKSKAAAQKKSNSNLNSGTTPAAETAPGPGRPVNSASLAKLGENAGPAQVVPTRQSAAPPPFTPTPIAPRPRVDPTQNDFGSMDVANFSTSGDVLNNFDFDSFIPDSAEETGV